MLRVGPHMSYVPQNFQVWKNMCFLALANLILITLWLFNIAMENGPIYRWFTWVYLFKDGDFP